MKKRYWLRGGIIGIGVFFLLFFFYALSELGNEPNENLKVVLNTLLYPVFWIISLFVDIKSSNANTILSLSLYGYVFSGFLYGIIGTIIGWFYGKIKNRCAKSVPTLTEYINKSRQAGKSDDVIKQELFSVGWNVSDVDVALTPVAQHSSIDTFVQKGKGARLNTLIVLVAVLVSIGVGYYFFIKEAKPISLGESSPVINQDNSEFLISLPDTPLGALMPIVDSISIAVDSNTSKHITIHGSGFSSSSLIYLFKGDDEQSYYGSAISPISVSGDGKSMTFTIPEPMDCYSSGYFVQVGNGKLLSSKIKFKSPCKVEG